MSVGSRTGLSGAAFLSGGSLIGNVVAFLASIALARMYSPSEHGQLAIISAYAVVLTPVVSGRLEAALLIPERDRDSFRLLMLGLTWATTLATTLTAVAFVFSEYDAGSGGRLRLPEYLWVAPVFALLSAYLLLVNQFNVRQARYKLVAARNVAYPASTAGAQVALGLVGSGGGGLVFGVIVGRILTLLLFVRELIRCAAEYAPDPASPSYRALLKRFSRFLSVFTVSAMINALGLQLPVLLLGVWYGSEAAGLFGMSQRTLAVPITLIGAAIGQVFLSEMSRAMREAPDEARQIFRRCSALLGIGGVIVSIVLLIAGPSLFVLVFGGSWRLSGEIAQAMGISLALQLVASPVSQALILYERHWVQLCWDVGRLLLVAAALCGAYLLGLNLVAACWVLGGATSLTYVASWYLAKRTVERNH